MAKLESATAVASIIIGLISIGVTILFFGVGYLGDISESVQSLNVKMATIVTKVENNEKRIDKLEGIQR